MTTELFDRKSIDTANGSYLLICKRFGRDYHTQAINRDDGHIITYYIGGSKQTALDWFDKAAATFALID